ncbi:ABC-F family ATP-binding cassette domain-containing protein [Brevibacterium sp. CS2]|uniref:ABC-F family ATP-binding cassette domain-containing protein n=1 Tax=Brevibacterium sp. CS2 TaxID=2575923 RepID=UPI0010C7A06F|nr:ABC-F family ATP-binding cassette domain-containing protein [Brevibacterium sp. CS2]QCP05099.1 ABC-F family ATP-binding cassette domain-containing protein [Brevibacterium sp. CS2]
MHLLGCESVSLSYPNRTILDEVTLGISAGDRIGIVGRNGDGKSTLMRILAGVLDPDSGRVTARGGTRVGYLEQADVLDPTLDVRTSVVGDAEEHKWASQPAVRDVMTGLLRDIDLGATVGELSGGQRRRVALARLLAGEWDIIMLDEPTNHLDITGVRWLAEHIRRRWPAGQGALLVVTHDRWFLDEVSTMTWEVHDATVDAFEGGYAAYVLQRVERDRQAAAVEAKRQNLMRKELAWLRRGAPARTSKPKFRIDAANALIAAEPPVRDTVELVSMATSRLGKDVFEMHDLDVAYPEASGGPVSGGGEPSTGDEASAGNDAPAGERASTGEPGPAGERPSAGEPVLSGLDWIIGPGDRYGLLGANGAGKSTLVKVLTGEIEPTAGRVKRGKTVKVAVLDQQLRDLDALADDRVREILARKRSTYQAAGGELTPSQLLEKLGLGTVLQSRVKDLSGGQQRRLQLLLILLDEPNVLILDEPTNDMDTDMLAAVEDLLDTWPGTLLVISHDRYFMERVTDHQFAVRNRTVRHLPGGIDEYLRLDADPALSGRADGVDTGSGATNGGSPNGGAGSVMSAVAGASGGSAGATSGNGSGGNGSGGGGSGLSATERRRLGKEVQALGRRIDKLDASIEALDAELAAHDQSDFTGLAELTAKRGAAAEEKDELELEWLELSEELEA